MGDFAAACLDGGASLLQIRGKSLSARDLLDATEGILRRAEGHAGASVIVNDRADVARAAGAAGVHVGQEDLLPADVRRVVGAEAIVGLSTHTPAQIVEAMGQPITYFAIGPVFGTATKDTGYNAVGLERVVAAAAQSRAAGLGLVAIGGITIETAPGVLAAGAQSVAVISDLLRTGDPASRVREYLRRLSGLAL